MTTKKNHRKQRREPGIKNKKVDIMNYKYILAVLLSTSLKYIKLYRVIS